MSAQALGSAAPATHKARRQARRADLANKPPIPIRHFDFRFVPEGIDTRFYLKAELASAYFQSLSIFLTYGEDLVIDTARHHRDFLDDPVLKQRVTSLIGQEALHSRIHEEWNEILKQNDFPVTVFRHLADFVFGYGFNRLPQPMKLSLMAAIEHFTAVLAEFMMKHEENFFHSDDEKQRALWMWHMLEESEHKDVAFDVFETLSGNYLLRITGFFPAMVTILGLILASGMFVPIYRRPRNLFNLRYWKDFRRSLGLLYGRQGVYGSALGHVFEYLKPGFHPNDHDTSEYLAYYKERLLNPQTGVLSPFFVKEFVPPLRTA